MQFLPKIALSAAVLAVTAGFASAQDSTTEAAPITSAETVVATVNGVDITMGHIIIARSGLPQQYQQLPDDVLFNGLVEQLVQQTLLSATADAPSRRAEMALENERRTILAGEVIQDVVEAAVTDEALQTKYDERYADAEPEREYNASHILVETQAEAEALKVDIDNGADFAALAMEHSTGPSGPDGGALGWFGPGMMVKPFEDAVAVLEVGAVSEPVQTQFGWHLVKLNEVRQKDAPELDAVREELVSELQRDAVDAHIAGLTESAEVLTTDPAELNLAAMRDLTLLEE